MKNPADPVARIIPSTVILPSRDVEGAVPYDEPVSPPRFDAIREVFSRGFRHRKPRLVTEPG